MTRERPGELVPLRPRSGASKHPRATPGQGTGEGADADADTDATPRPQKVRSLTFHAKYAAGEGPGGDFFDVTARGSALSLVLATSGSHASSMAVLSRFGPFRDGFPDAGPRGFVEGLAGDLEEDDVDLLVLSLDLNTLRGGGLSFGGHRMLSTGPVDVGPPGARLVPPSFGDAAFDLALARGERAVLVSAGLAGGLPGARDLRGELPGMDPAKFLDGLFSRLRGAAPGEFPRRDASCITMEVDRNAILQV